jgi:hypothetical protein
MDSARHVGIQDLDVPDTAGFCDEPQPFAALADLGGVLRSDDRGLARRPDNDVDNDPSSALVR